jgi:hypothetical protein
MTMDMLPGHLQGRWLVVSSGDENWERMRGDFDFVFEFEATTTFRIVARPKNAKANAVVGGLNFVEEEDYRIENGFFVQRFGDLELVSRVISGPEDDEIILERVRVEGCWSGDDSVLARLRVVLRRLRE